MKERISLISRNEALVHFSGGADSTLCAALLAEKHKRVHLMSYDRLSFIGAADYTRLNYDRLCKIYGPEKFAHKIVRVDQLHKRICYQNYFKIAARYKLAVTVLTFCKLAMHWYSAAYALKNGISVVADGAVPYMELYPDQNEKICLSALRGFYGELGVEYQNPAYALADQVEQILYDKGITERPLVRGTESDKQVFYLEQVILALFLKYYLASHGREKYEETVGALFRDRLALMKSAINEVVL